MPAHKTDSPKERDAKRDTEIKRLDPPIRPRRRDVGDDRDGRQRPADREKDSRQKGKSDDPRHEE